MLSSLLPSSLSAQLLWATQDRSLTGVCGWLLPLAWTKEILAPVNSLTKLLVIIHGTKYLLQQCAKNEYPSFLF